MGSASKMTYFAFFLIFYMKKISCNTNDTIMAGNKTIEECINGPRERNIELEITTSEMIRKEGYPVEDHVVLTDDGYLLTLNRIPGPASAPTIFLQHGLLWSSFGWVMNGMNQSLAFFLSDQGYDVWLGNFRGSTYSRCHNKYTTSDRSYWNFSFYEHGIYDLPAQINYVTKIKNDNIIYVGQSMGTTAFFVMATERLDVATKVKVMFALAPIAYTYYMKGVVMIGTAFSSLIQIFSQHITSGQVFAQTKLWKYLITYGCYILTEKICGDLIFTVFGFDAPQLNYTRIMLYLNHFPSGSSAKVLQHLSQGALKGTFRRFDYGTKGNLIMYNNTEPPDFNLSKIQVPIGIFWAENDYLAAPEDVRHFYDSIPNKILNYKIKYPKFNHFDFVMAIDARKLVYEELVFAINKYR